MDSYYEKSGGFQDQMPHGDFDDISYESSMPRDSLATDDFSRSGIGYDSFIQQTLNLKLEPIEETEPVPKDTREMLQHIAKPTPEIIDAPAEAHDDSSSVSSDFSYGKTYDQQDVESSGEKLYRKSLDRAPQAAGHETVAPVVESVPVYNGAVQPNASQDPYYQNDGYYQQGYYAQAPAGGYYYQQQSTQAVYAYPVPAYSVPVAADPSYPVQSTAPAAYTNADTAFSPGPPANYQPQPAAANAAVYPNHASSAVGPGAGYGQSKPPQNYQAYNHSYRNPASPTRANSRAKRPRPPVEKDEPSKRDSHLLDSEQSARYCCGIYKSRRQCLLICSPITIVLIVGLAITAFFIWPREPNFQFGLPSKLSDTQMGSVDDLRAGTFKALFRWNVNMTIHSNSYIPWSTDFSVVVNIASPVRDSTNFYGPLGTGVKTIDLPAQGQILKGYDMNMTYVLEAAINSRSDITLAKTPILFSLFMSCNPNALGFEAYPNHPAGVLGVHAKSSVQFLNFQFNGAVSKPSFSCPSAITDILTFISTNIK
ncbi:hypothetical protein HDV03_003835 [Kappamyces sp. JEL0829]|nr:hypothetical protein HDV03_003835 [Kappamyces sp. JEL0829]